MHPIIPAVPCSSGCCAVLFCHGAPILTRARLQPGCKEGEMRRAGFSWSPAQGVKQLSQLPLAVRTPQPSLLYAVLGVGWGSNSPPWLTAPGCQSSACKAFPWLRAVEHRGSDAHPFLPSVCIRMCRALPKREAGRFKGKGLGPAGLPALPAQFQPHSRHPNSLLKAGRGGRIRNCCDSTTTQPLSVMKRANLGNQEAVYKQPKIDVSFALTSLRRTAKRIAGRCIN